MTPILTNTILIVTNLLIMKNLSYSKEIIPFMVMRCDEKKKKKEEKIQESSLLQDFNIDKAIQTNS